MKTDAHTMLQKDFNIDFEILGSFQEVIKRTYRIFSASLELLERNRELVSFFYGSIVSCFFSKKTENTSLMFRF